MKPQWPPAQDDELLGGLVGGDDGEVFAGGFGDALGFAAEGGGFVDEVAADAEGDGSGL